MKNNRLNHRRPTPKKLHADRRGEIRVFGKMSRKWPRAGDFSKTDFEVGFRYRFLTLRTHQDSRVDRQTKFRRSKSRRSPDIRRNVKIGVLSVPSGIWQTCRFWKLIAAQLASLNCPDNHSNVREASLPTGVAKSVFFGKCLENGRGPATFSKTDFAIDF